MIAAGLVGLPVEDRHDIVGHDERVFIQSIVPALGLRPSVKDLSSHAKPPSSGTFSIAHGCVPDNFWSQRVPASDA